MSKEDLTSEVELQVMMGLRYSFAEKRRKANKTEKNKAYLFCKSLTAGLMTLLTKYERLIPKNESRIVLFKNQMANLSHSAVSSPEASQTYFNQIPASTIQPHSVHSM